MTNRIADHEVAFGKLPRAWHTVSDLVMNGISGLIDPNADVFGVQIPRTLAQLLMDRLSFLNENSRYDRPPPRPKLVFSETNGGASALGAALTPLRHFFF
ncbi:hypothetical protein AWB64_01274 [Caballeronia sordidicola]|uniref:Uncharacterized protein n=1 Tax=Caballeronia sordidicola TaxID=196367 RepID=A0A158FHX4_CABSO|nr:hypothetical protein [Caballeronia sordidicola]SAL18650.1 hypothetical protein AWB64_01274 [Caballeronia sordidicola]